MADAEPGLWLAKWHDPFVMDAAEAQGAGTPLIPYRGGAVSEIIIDGQTGFLTPPDDVAGAARALKAVSRITRAKCRKHAVVDLSLEASLVAHERLYRTLRPRVELNRGA